MMPRDEEYIKDSKRWKFARATRSHFAGSARRGDALQHNVLVRDVGVVVMGHVLTVAEGISVLEAQRIHRGGLVRGACEREQEVLLESIRWIVTIGTALDHS